MTRPIWAMIANHYTKRRGLSASHVTRIAAKAAPEGGGGDYGPNSGGYDQLGFGTLAFSRDKGAVGTGTPSPSASRAERSGSGSRAGSGTPSRASAEPSAGASAQGGRAAGDDLAATGSSDLPLWTAATGITAVAGGLLLLRRRGQARRGTE
jgi:hypothetical protein